MLCTAIAYLFYFALIHSVGALKTLTVTFLVPVFGVIWGRLFLQEPVTLRILLGLLIILSSVALVANVRVDRTRHRNAEASRNGDRRGHRPESTVEDALNVMRCEE
ncbi:hypothetical protein GCM10025857_24030 [Alicyclobacillus contaminans]|nr:hypothetical protein GCM10025857_24030 [Alicyclobacillus contaminans]